MKAETVLKNIRKREEESQNIYKKTNALIEIKHTIPNDTAAYKVFNALLIFVAPECGGATSGNDVEKVNGEITTTFSEIEKIACLGASGQNRAKVKSIVAQLMTTTFTLTSTFIKTEKIIDQKGNEKIKYRPMQEIFTGPIFMGVGSIEDLSEKKSTKFKFLFNSLFIQCVRNLSYTLIDQKELFSLGSFYSMRIYELLKQRQNMRKGKTYWWRPLTEEEARSYLRIEEGETKGPGQLNRLIDRAICDIEKNTTLHIKRINKKSAGSTVIYLYSSEKTENKITSQATTQPQNETKIEEEEINQEFEELVADLEAQIAVMDEESRIAINKVITDSTYEAAKKTVMGRKNALIKNADLIREMGREK